MNGSIHQFLVYHTLITEAFIFAAFNMRNHYSKRMMSNFIALTIIQGTNFLLPLIVMPYVISRIGMDGFGVVSIAQVVMIYMSTISDYGFNLTATRDVSIHRQNENKLSKIFFLVLASKLFITILLFILLLIFTLLIPFLRAHFLLYVLGFTYVIGQSLLVSWFFQGMERMHYITVITLLARFLFVVLVFAFIRNHGDDIYFLFFLGIGNIVAGVVSIFLAMRYFHLKPEWPQWNHIRGELKEGWQVTFSNISINTYQYINIFVLRLFTNDLIVGYYSIAEKIFFAIRQILGVFSQVIYPKVCQLAVNGKDGLSGFFNRIFIPFLFAVCACCIGLFIFAPQIVGFFVAGTPDLSVLLLRILSIVPIIVCLNIPAYQVLLAFDHKKSYSGVLGLGTLVNVAANLILCSTWGPVGTVISIIITELFITIGLNQQLYKHNLVYYKRSSAI